MGYYIFKELIELSFEINIFVQYILTDTLKVFSHYFKLYICILFSHLHS